MIDIRELRIGNPVSTNRGKGFVSSLRLIEDKDKTFNNLPIVVSICHGTEYEVDEVDLFPINLTEEIRLYFPKWFADKISNGFFNYSDGNDTQSLNVNYVHTAQNLYFALTGKELEVKL